MYYRVIVNKFNSGFEQALATKNFGRVESCHNDSYNANEAVTKAKRGRHCFDDFAVIYTEEKLKKGECYPDLVYQLHSDNNRKHCIELCSRVLAGLAEGKDLSKFDYIVSHPVDEFGQDVSYDDWMAKFTCEAQLLLEERDKAEQEKARLFNNFVIDLIKNIPVGKYIDLENTSVNAKSPFLWSLVHFKKFIEALSGFKEKAFNKTGVDLMHQMVLKKSVNIIFDVLCSGEDSEFASLLNGDLKPADLRNEYISGYAVFLESLGLALASAIEVSSVLSGEFDELQFRSFVCKMAGVERYLNSDCWQNRCVRAERLVKNNDSVNLTAAVFRREGDLQLTEKMIEIENRYGFNFSV